MAKPSGRPNGRPTMYSDELAQKICDLIASSTDGLQKLCDAHDDLPAKAATIHSWRWRNDNFNDMYMKARSAQCDLLVEECLDIADDTSRDTVINANGQEVCNSEYVNRSRLRVDTRKWLATKLLWKVYGNRPEEKEKSDAESLLEKILNGEITLNKK